MNVLVTLRELLKGKKTYIIGITLMLIGFELEDQAMILNGLAFMTIRAGIKGVEETLRDK